MWYSALAAAMLLAPALGASGTPIGGTGSGGTPTVATPAKGDPKLRVKLSEDDLMPGDKAKVKVKASSDGYLVVLRRDTQGNVKVLYPVDPSDSATIRRGKEIEIRSRGDREAFTVAEHAGVGAVLAARADRPFDFSMFTSGSHWSSASFTNDLARKDAEEDLLSVVDKMSAGQHYDYDVTTYSVSVPSRRTYANRGYGMYGARYLGWYDPFSLGFYSTWPFYYPSYGYASYYGWGPSIGFGGVFRVGGGRGFPRGRGRR